MVFMLETTTDISILPPIELPLLPNDQMIHIWLHGMMEQQAILLPMQLVVPMGQLMLLSLWLQIQML